MGSRFPITRLVEWYKVWTSLEELRVSAENRNEPCHVCKLVWYSISETRRRKICESRSAVSDQRVKISKENISSQRSMAASEKEQSKQPELDEPSQRNYSTRDWATGWFGIKVWEERPLSPYTYIQLFHNGVEVGSRLLAHRGAHFMEREFSLQNDMKTEINFQIAASAATHQPSTASREHVELARTWNETCQSHHVPCKDIRGVRRTMPTRLIYVEPSSSDPPTVKLKEMGKEETPVEYMAFSHCWGGSPTFRLLPDNYSSALQAIDFSTLSKNAQDAVRITRALGFLYIWIDSVCIIQGPDGDWATEAPRMGDVYSGAVCTIASTGSPSGDGGCYHERDAQSLLPCIVNGSLRKSGVLESICIRRDDVFDFERYVDRAPLNKRAWVVQERLLSPRILHFGAEMLYWECRCRSASELAPNGYVYGTYYDSEGDNPIGSSGTSYPTNIQIAEMIDRQLAALMGKETIKYRPPPPAADPDDRRETPGIEIWKSKDSPQKREIRSLSGNPWTSDALKEQGRSGIQRSLGKLLKKEFSSGLELDVHSFSNCWYELVNLYSRGNLTFESDKLVALNGIASEIQKATGYTYTEGLWEQHLLTDLLWYAIEHPGRRLKPRTLHDITTVQAKPDTQFADVPTWSWASLEGVIGLGLIPNSPQEVLKIKKVLARTASTIGKWSPGLEPETVVPGGALVLKGRLCHAVKMKGSEGYEGSPFWEHATVFKDVDDASIWDESDGCLTKLFFFAILQLSRTSAKTTTEVQGLVIRYMGEGANSMEIFQRVGLFKLGPTSGNSKAFEYVNEAPLKTVYIV